MSRGTRAVINLGALQHNFQLARQRAPCSQVLAVVKANGYGSGLVPVAQALPDADGFGVATFDEGCALREAGIQQPVLLLEGVLSTDELQLAAARQFQIVVHQPWQLEMLLAASLSMPMVVWLKVDTGMHRLGIPAQECGPIWRQLQNCPNVLDQVLMSHLACADQSEHPLNLSQLEGFQSLVNHTATRASSLANSAGLMRGESYQYQWVRPGLMLYGATPLLETAAADLNLQPVMQLESRVISKSSVVAGSTVGYGATWTASRDTVIAVVAIGYGDGYPRHVSAAAFVLIDGQPCPVVGRVSMDMLTVDISALSDVAIGARVILWGQGLPVEWVAQWAGTVNYELLCQVTARVPRVYQAH